MIIEAYNPDIHNLMDHLEIEPGDAVIIVKDSCQVVPALYHTNTNGLPHAKRALNLERPEFAISDLVESQLHEHVA